MPSAFTGKRIVVIGAGGIGIETVRLFMEQGGHILMVDVDEAALQRAQAQLGRVMLGPIGYTLNSIVTPNASVAGTSTLVPMRSTPRMPAASGAVSPASSDRVRNVSAAM